MKKYLCLITYLLVYFSALGQQPAVKVIIHSFTGYGNYESFGQSAALALEKVLQSNKFHQAILDGVFTKKGNYTNQQLYDFIIKAHEKDGQGGADNVVDLGVRTLRIDSDESKWRNNCQPGSSSGTIGIDGNNDGVTAICPQRLAMWAEENNISNLAGHYAHEYMHILGFDHYRWPYSTQKWRDKTFVYQVGYIVRNIIKADPSLQHLN